MDNHYGKLLKYLRTKSGLSQYKVADLLDIPRSRYGNYEAGISMAPRDIQMKIAKLYEPVLDDWNFDSDIIIETIGLDNFANLIVDTINDQTATRLSTSTTIEILLGVVDYIKQQQLNADFEADGYETLNEFYTASEIEEIKNKTYSENNQKRIDAKFDLIRRKYK